MNTIMLADYTVMVHDKMVKVSETTKDVHWVLLENKIKRPRSEEKWQIKCLTHIHLDMQT